MGIDWSNAFASDSDRCENGQPNRDKRDQQGKDAYQWTFREKALCSWSYLPFLKAGLEENKDEAGVMVESCRVGLTIAWLRTSNARRHLGGSDEKKDRLHWRDSWFCWT